MARVAILIGLLFFLCPTAAWAQNPEAVKLFEEGRAAMKRGDTNLACAKFEQSNAIDKRVGTLLNLALCEEKRQRLVRALETWRAAEELAKRLADKRETEASSRAAKLEPRVPKLTLTLTADAPQGTRVRLEALTLPARVLEPGELGKPILVDPGEVNVTVIGPDGAESNQTVSLAEGDTESLELGGAVPKPKPRPDDGADSAGGVDGLLIAGIVVGVIGLAGIGVGSGFGLDAKSKHDESNDGPCNEADDVCTTQVGFDLRDEAIESATVSTVLFVVGGVALAAGVTLIAVSLTSDDEPAATASRLRLGVTPTGFNARLSW